MKKSLIHTIIEGSPEPEQSWVRQAFVPDEPNPNPYRFNDGISVNDGPPELQARRWNFGNQETLAMTGEGMVNFEPWSAEDILSLGQRVRIGEREYIVADRSGRKPLPPLDVAMLLKTGAMVRCKPSRKNKAVMRDMQVILCGLCMIAMVACLLISIIIEVLK